MFENKPREIKYKTGVKEYDEKVNEFYTRLVKSVDTYTSENVLSQLIYWEDILFSKITDDLSAKGIEKIFMLSRWDQKRIQGHINDLAWHDELKSLLYSPEQTEDFEFMCFAKALVFYLSQLEYLKDLFYKLKYRKKASLQESGEIFAFAYDVILTPENLNFYKTFIEENSKRLYEYLHVDYLENIEKINEKQFTSSEKDEFTRLLSTNDKGGDWGYLIKRLKSVHFHKLAEIREILIELYTGSYYELVFRYGEEKIIMAEVLAIQKYINFLNNPFSVENGSDSAKKHPAKRKPKEAERRGFNLTDKGSDNPRFLKNLSESMINKKIIDQIDIEDFTKIFTGGIVERKINFIGKHTGEGGGLIDVVWFTFLMWEVWEVLRIGNNFRPRIANCFLINGEPIPSDKGSLDMISVLRNGNIKYWKAYKPEILKDKNTAAKLIKRNITIKEMYFIIQNAINN